MQALRFFNPYADIHHTENRLPHWQQEGAVYFVTFRLGDSLPSRLLTQWENDRNAWLRLHPEPWSNEIERKSSANIINVSRVPLSAGSMPDMAVVFCDDGSACRSWERPCAISKVNALS
jgi:hypothetical protein